MFKFVELFVFKRLFRYDAPKTAVFCYSDIKCRSSVNIHKSFVVCSCHLFSHLKNHSDFIFLSSFLVEMHCAISLSVNVDAGACIDAGVGMDVGVCVGDYGNEECHLLVWCRYQV